MARTATIVLDGVDYVVHAFNIGELEQATEAFEGKPSLVPYAVLRIALKRATPHVNGGVDAIEPTFDEINQAFETISGLSGIGVKKDPTVPVAPAQG